MPEWLWSIVIGVVVLGLVGLVWHAQTEKIAGLEKEIWRLREWRHTKGDPYVGACDALKDRVDRLDRKIFNGRP